MVNKEEEEEEERRRLIDCVSFPVVFRKWEIKQETFCRVVNNRNGVAAFKISYYKQPMGPDDHIETPCGVSQFVMKKKNPNLPINKLYLLACLLSIKVAT